MIIGFDARNMSEYHRTRFLSRIDSRGFDTYIKWVHMGALIIQKKNDLQVLGMNQFTLTC